jgi:LemA protein
MKQTLLIIVGIIAVIAFMLFGSYNSLVTKTTAIDGQWAQVETQYQRRLDLIPNLVESVKGVMTQEKEVFGLIADARTKYAGAQTVDQKSESATQMESALGRLLVVMENYPVLKSNETVSKLMDELAGTENRVSVERRRFNDLVQDYNLSIKKIPTNFIAMMFGFSEHKYFEAANGAENAPKVDLSK